MQFCKAAAAAGAEAQGEGGREGIRQFPWNPKRKRRALAAYFNGLSQTWTLLFPLLLLLLSLSTGESFLRADSQQRRTLSLSSSPPSVLCVPPSSFPSPFTLQFFTPACPTGLHPVPSRSCTASTGDDTITWKSEGESPHQHHVAHVLVRLILSPRSSPPPPRPPPSSVAGRPRPRLRPREEEVGAGAGEGKS